MVFIQQLKSCRGSCQLALHEFQTSSSFSDARLFLTGQQGVEQKFCHVDSGQCHRWLLQVAPVTPRYMDMNAMELQSPECIHKMFVCVYTYDIIWHVITGNVKFLRDSRKVYLVQ